MPIGVGSGLGCTNRLVLVSTGMRAVGSSLSSLRGGRFSVPWRDSFGEEGVAVERDALAAATSPGDAMAMAVDIRCAITHPTIFSRRVADERDADGSKNR